MKDDVGDMMCEEEYMYFAKTPRGGKLTPLEAQVEWKRMDSLKNVPSPGILVDDKGPKGQTTRIRISVKDLVVFRNRFAREREVEAISKQVKKPTAAHLNEMCDDILRGHADHMGGMGVDDVAKAMVGTGGSRAAAFQSAHVGSVRDLDDVESEDEDGEEARWHQYNSAQPPPEVRRQRRQCDRRSLNH